MLFFVTLNFGAEHKKIKNNNFSKTFTIPEKLENLFSPNRKFPL